MAIRMFTDDAASLLNEIRRQIKAGEILTWAVDKDGDFTHVTRGDQWENRAWLRPTPEKDRLRLNIMIQPNERQRREVYAVYQGRFIEMVLRHVPNLFTVASATPFFTDQDSALNRA